MPAYWIPRNREGKGWVRLTCSDSGAQLLRFDALARKLQQRHGLPATAPLPEVEPRGTKSGHYYRVVLDGRYPSGALLAPRFALDKGHPKTTLQVLVDHFNEEGIRWKRLRDGHGNTWQLDCFLPPQQPPGA